MPMLTAINTATARLFQTLGVGSFFALLYILVMHAGPQLEFASRPVVSNVSITVLEKTEETVDFLLRFSKDRPCQATGAAWFVQTPNGTEAVTMRFLDPEPIDDRPMGWNVSRPIRVSIPRRLQAYESFGIARYNCGMPWNTTAIFGPFPPFWTVTPQSRTNALVVKPVARVHNLIGLID